VEAKRAFIEDEHRLGTDIFILVGIDLKRPLCLGGRHVAHPDSGVLCDTDGELSIGDGYTKQVACLPRR